MPFVFTNRCIRLDKFVESINDSYKDLQMRKKLYQKQQQTRQLSCQQYISLSKVIDQTANEIAQKVVFDVNAEERIIKFLNNKDVMPKVVMVIIDELLRTRVEIDINVEEFSDLSISKDCLLQKVSQITGAQLTEFNVQRRKDIVKISMSTKETFFPVYAFMSVKKEGESISGDNVGIFKTDRSKLVMQIGDGMGSGQRAALDSAVASKVVKRIISAGFDNEAAITILNSALLLKSDDESVISIDIAVLDLYTGDCEFVKLGAAPTYVMRSGLISRIDANSLPMGILDKAEAKSTVMTLGFKDIILMVSDGVISNGDDFIFDMLQRHKELDPRDICNLVLNEAKQKNGGIFKDDMSVICTKL
jgi:stage II sporulation protein E